MIKICQHIYSFHDCSELFIFQKENDLNTYSLIMELHKDRNVVIMNSDCLERTLPQDFNYRKLIKTFMETKKAIRNFKSGNV